MKLKELLYKVTCGWLGQIKSSIKSRPSDIPTTYTFSQSPQAFKTEVNIKYPPGAVATRRVQEMGKSRGRVRYKGRDSVRYGGIFRGQGIFGRGRGCVYSPKL